MYLSSPRLFVMMGVAVIGSWRTSSAPGKFEGVSYDSDRGIEY